MYKHRLTLLFRSGVFCLLAYSHILSPAHAEPTSESTVSSAQLALDQQVSITIKMTWDAAEGNYEITQKHWAPENLEFAKQKIANEAYSLAGKEWQERTYTFLFNPKKKGPAFIRDIRLSYINTKTKKPGQIKFPVELSFFVGQPIRSKFWFVIISLCVLVALIMGGSAAMNYYTRYVTKARNEADKMLRNQIYSSAAKSIREFSSSILKLAYGEWSKELKTFVILHYMLSRRDMTESEALEEVRLKNDIQPKEKQALNRLFERLSNARYGNVALKLPEHEKLRNDILEFIESKRVINAVTRDDV